MVVKYSVMLTFTVITITNIIIATAIANIIIIIIRSFIILAFFYQNHSNLTIMLWHLCKLRIHYAYVVSILETIETRELKYRKEESIMFLWLLCR